MAILVCMVAQLLFELANGRDWVLESIFPRIECERIRAFTCHCFQARECELVIEIVGKSLAWWVGPKGVAGCLSAPFSLAALRHQKTWIYVGKKAL
jgi:hypothetical protein